VRELQKQRRKSSGSLVTQVSTILREAISSGTYLPGARLPSEIELTETHGVSRSVVREAVTALRCDGLVEVRQGAGIFVLKTDLGGTPPPRVDRARLSSDLELLEIRAPLEIEAAGLAALRCSPSQEEALFKCHAKYLECIEQQSPIRDADFALHLAIAAATNNPLFTQFLETHGNATIPQSKLASEAQEAEKTAYRRLIHKEHETIILAISDRDEQAAKIAMQQHLRGSQRRYRDMMRDIGGISAS